MINKIISGISEALFTEFGETYEIYKEKIEQGLHEPCFFIQCLNPTNEQFLGKRYFRTNQFAVQYFPSSNAPKNECYAVMERLNNCLEIITVDDEKCRGAKMEGQVLDDVLTFTLNYDLFVYKVDTEPVDRMESHIFTAGAKG